LHNQNFNVTYPCLIFAIKEIVVQIETSTLNEILLVLKKITAVFSFFESEYLSANYIHHHYNKPGDEEIEEEEKMLNVDVYCKKLNSTTPSIIGEDLQAGRQYFEFVNIGAVRIILTLRFEHKNLDLNIVNEGGGIFSIGYTLFSNIASISDSPLNFKELILTHTYSNPDTLVDLIIRNFASQGVLQFYKLIGSSDMLGNPVGFVNKLGSGIYEFYNEPKKGLIKGPTHFVGGVGKGVTSLVGGVASASFDSFSKITGSLYNATKDISGQEVKREKAPENIAQGVYEGAKGGISEIGYGKLQF
jgi:hypothetical protein